MELNLKDLRYVIFDWDNTLAESRTALVTVVNEVLAEYGLPDWDIVKKKRDANLSFRDNFPNIFGADANKAYQRYAEIYTQKIPSLIKTFSYVHETLEFFHSRHIPMIIMSNKDRLLLEIELPIIFNPNLFLRVICGHEAPRDKPYPEHIFYSLQGLLKPNEITPQKVWMIGDSAQDSDCAIAANALPIRIGQPIWNDEAEQNTQVIYFAGFKILYNLLISGK